MRIAFIETSGLTNDLLRAVAGAAPNCVGYPDGVPESWADALPAPASCYEQGRLCFSDGGRVCKKCGHTVRTRLETPGRLLVAGKAGRGALDPAALLGPIAEPVEPLGLRALVEKHGPIYVQRPHARLTFGEDGSFNYQLLDAPTYKDLPDWPERDGADDEEC